MNILSCSKSKQESLSIKDRNSSGASEEAATGEVRMDIGPIHRKLLAYAAPLLLMQLLLQFYNIADCAVVGRFGGAFGLAAVGVAGLVLAVHINFFIGFGVGVTSAVSRLFGARQYDKLRQAIATSVAIATAAGILLMLMGELLGKRYLLWLSCPAEAMGDALLYAQICFLGLIPQLVYNVSNGVLRALGNTKTPLYYLAGSAVLNVVLDLVLAVGMNCGLEGVAWATVSAQWVLGLAMVWRLTRLDERFRLTAGTTLLPMSELFRLLRLGIPSGMQAAFMSISSLLIQISIDGFGPAAMAGMVVYAKIEGFLYYPAFAYGMALTGFIGQNLGSGRLDRVEEAMRISRRTAIYGTMAVCAGQFGDLVTDGFIGGRPEECRTDTNRRAVSRLFHGGRGDTCKRPCRRILDLPVLFPLFPESGVHRRAQRVGRDGYPHVFRAVRLCPVPGTVVRSVVASLV